MVCQNYLLKCQFKYFLDRQAFIFTHLFIAMGFLQFKIHLDFIPSLVFFSFNFLSFISSHLIFFTDRFNQFLYISKFYQIYIQSYMHHNQLHDNVKAIQNLHNLWIHFLNQIKSQLYLLIFYHFSIFHKYFPKLFFQNILLEMIKL
jgi:hypothetical protein